MVGYMLVRLTTSKGGLSNTMMDIVLALDQTCLGGCATLKNLRRALKHVGVNVNLSDREGVD